MFCPNCDCVIFSNNIIKVKEMMFGTEEVFHYYFCENCNSLSLKDVPQCYERYYKNYYTDFKNFLDISEFKRKLWAIRRMLSNTILFPFINFFFYNDILKWAHYTKIKTQSYILDVGCGNGYLLNEFFKHGFRNLYGVDPFLDNLEYSHIKLYKTDFLNFDTEIKFDLIMFHHSFEHILNQGEVLKKSKYLLSNNGVILIRMPIINKAYQIYKENWVQIDAPRHITIHSEKSMNILCERFGLEIYHSYYDSTAFQFLGSEQFKHGISLYSENSYKVNLMKSMFSERDYKKFNKLAKQYNKKRIGDQAAFFIRKKC